MLHEYGINFSFSPQAGYKLFHYEKVYLPAKEKYRQAIYIQNIGDLLTLLNFWNGADDWKYYTKDR
jgi:hypothetical protein